MAGNTYFSFQVPLDNDEQVTWLKKFLKYTENCEGDTVKPEHGNESRELLEVFPNWNEHEVLGFGWEVKWVIDGLWIYSEDHESLAERAADIVEFFLRKFKRKDAIGFEYAHTSDAHRLNGFYGGACVVSALSQDWHSLEIFNFVYRPGVRVERVTGRKPGSR